MQRRVTIPHPELRHAAVTMHDYVSVPAIETRGAWKVVELLSDESLAMLAIYYTRLTKGKGW